jgi:DNA polymerase I
MQHNLGVRIALVPGPGNGGLLCRLRDDGTAAGQPEPVTDLPAAVAAHQETGTVRWVWTSARSLYPDLLRSGVQVARCHDVDLVAGLLTARDGHAGQPGGGHLRSCPSTQPTALSRIRTTASPR